MPDVDHEPAGEARILDALSRLKVEFARNSSLLERYGPALEEFNRRTEAGVTVKGGSGGARALLEQLATPENITAAAGLAGGLLAGLGAKMRRQAKRKRNPPPEYDDEYDDDDDDWEEEDE